MENIFVGNIREHAPSLVVSVSGFMDNDDALKREEVAPIYKKVKGFQPLHLDWGRFIVDTILRNGKAHSNHGNNVQRVLKNIVHLIRKDYSMDVPIILLADAGFFDEKLFLLCNELNIGFVIGGKMYQDIKDTITNYSGEVLIDGRKPDSHGNSYHERIGVAFEFPHFYEKFTARENLRFFGSLYKKTGNDRKKLNSIITDLLSEVGLQNDGDKKTGEFSKGMKMRLNLCRALIHSPELLYLDEPTSGLDPVNSRNIRRIIRTEASGGKTIFLTTHNMEVASELCDRVAFLNEGVLTVIDTPQNLMHSHGKPEVRLEFINGDGQETADFALPGLGKNEEFLKLIGEKEIRTIHSREATLEDVFVMLTGRGLE